MESSGQTAQMASQKITDSFKLPMNVKGKMNERKAR